MPIILGIDPGSQVTGYGVIEAQSRRLRYVASGCIRIAKLSWGERLRQIFQGIQMVIAQYQPDEAAIEEVFMHRNASAALKLGQARGAAIVAMDIPISEYAARTVKQTIVGYGAAEKNQVQMMVTQLLLVQGTMSKDAADALAIAICHAQHRKFV